MFRVTSSDPRIFRDSMDIISQLIDDGLFKLKKEGIELIAADRAMVSVVDFKIKNTAFEKYECDKDGIIGLNLLNFLTVLKRIGPEDKMILELNEKENKLEVIIEGLSRRKFSIPLLEISREEIPPIAQLQFQASAEIRADVIEQGINDADIFADSVIIQLGDGFRMVAEGDSSKTELNLERGNEALLNIDYKTVAKSRYPLDYLKKMIKASKLSDKAKIFTGTDYPLKLEFVGNDVSMTFILAPRVSEE
jgi:proliferating cell nuclear antigen